MTCYELEGFMRQMKLLMRMVYQEINWVNCERSSIPIPKELVITALWNGSRLTRYTRGWWSLHTPASIWKVVTPTRHAIIDSYRPSASHLIRVTETQLTCGKKPHLYCNSQQINKHTTGRPQAIHSLSIATSMAHSASPPQDSLLFGSIGVGACGHHCLLAEYKTVTTDIYALNATQ